MAQQRPQKRLTASRKAASPSESPVPTSAEGGNPVEPAMESAAKLAENELGLARLFLAHHKPEIARRRLEAVLTDYGDSDAAQEARRMLRQM